MIFLTSTSAVVFTVAYHSLLEGSRVLMRLYTLHCSYAVYLPTHLLQYHGSCKYARIRSVIAMSVLERKVNESLNIGFYIS